MIVLWPRRPSAAALVAALLLSMTPAGAIAAKDTSIGGDNDQCGIYFAPSTIPGAGMGMFAGKAYPADTWLTTGDILVPLIDWAEQNHHISIEEILMQSYYWLTYAYVCTRRRLRDSVHDGRWGSHVSSLCFLLTVSPECQTKATTKWRTYWTVSSERILCRVDDNAERAHHSHLFLVVSHRALVRQSTVSFHCTIPKLGTKPSK